MIHVQLMSIVLMEIANELNHGKIRDLKTLLINVFNPIRCLSKKKTQQVLVHEIKISNL